MSLEITEEYDEENPLTNTLKKEGIKRIIEYQKSIYSSSLSDKISAESSSTHQSKRLMELMESGNTSLRRLFDMEDTRLANHLKDYYGYPPVTKWESNREDEGHDPWLAINELTRPDSAIETHSVNHQVGVNTRRRQRARNRKLTRKKSFKRLPGGLRCMIFRFRLRIKRVRIIICSKFF